MQLTPILFYHTSYNVQIWEEGEELALDDGLHACKVRRDSFKLLPSAATMDIFET